MIFFSLITVYLLLFAWFAWRNFRWAVGFFILTLPAYLIRFSVGPLPTTLLEMEFAGLFLVWLIKYFPIDLPKIIDLIKKQRRLFIFIGLFFLASVINIFVSGIDDSNYWHMTVEALGIWRAFFLEPVILFFMLVGRCHSRHAYRHLPAGRHGAGESGNPGQNQLDPRRSLPSTTIGGGDDSLATGDLVTFLIFSTVSISVVAILQKISPWFYPPQLWDDVVGGRVTSFFTTPNAIGLYLAPVMILTLVVIIKKLQMTNPKMQVFKNKLFLGSVSTLLLTIIAIILSVSQGAWVALGAGVVVFLYLVGWRKIAIVFALLAVSAGFYFIDIRTALLFQDQAGRNRLKLWSYTTHYLAASPQNFVFGTGIRKFFDKVQKPYYNQKQLEALQYPHNIVLNFWTEIGLLGMIAFVGILVYLFLSSWQIRKSDKILGAGLTAALAVFIVHGLVDVPYFKNDLAFIFWILVILYVLPLFSSDGARSSGA